MNTYDRTMYLLARLWNTPVFIGLQGVYLILRHDSDTLLIFYSNDYETISAGLEPASQKPPSLYVATCLVC
jgi:hypothetical protein